jgi:hypothetical protein
MSLEMLDASMLLPAAIATSFLLMGLAYTHYRMAGIEKERLSLLNEVMGLRLELRRTRDLLEVDVLGAKESPVTVHKPEPANAPVYDFSYATCKSAIMQVIRETKRPMAPQELTHILLRNGYKTTSPDFGKKGIYTCLYLLKNDGLLQKDGSLWSEAKEANYKSIGISKHY